MDSSAYLPQYYKKIFPTDVLYDFLRRSPNREISITLQSNVYIRTLSFSSSSELSSFLIQKVPQKIDIGAVYISRPEQGAELLALQKELVFDIDLTDYTRHCCEGKKICDRCFTLIKCAGKIMDHILRNVFGFKDILYVFSGGRGLHIWVCDVEARFMDDRERKGIIEFINPKKNIEKCYNKEMKEILQYYDYYFSDQDIKVDINEKNLYEYLYVKLDKNVTSDIKHLLKSPFSVHPTSGMVSVPLSLEMLEDVKVADLPKISDVLENEQSLKKYIQYLEDFVKTSY